MPGEEPDKWDLDEMRKVVESIDRGVKKIRKSGLSERALLILIQQSSPTLSDSRARKPRLAEIEAVLEGLDGLKAFVYGEENGS